MDIKVGIKEEPCFQNFCSENERVTIDLVKKFKVETSDNVINPELEDSKCFTLNEDYHLMSFNETITESEIESKIDVKEEKWWLEREDSSVHDDIKNETQEDTYATKPPSLYKEELSTYTSDFSSTENVENDVGFNMNMANGQCGSDRKCPGQESADMCSTETEFCSETSDDVEIISMASCLKQSKLLHQCNTNKQDINKKNCKSTSSNKYRESYKCDVPNNCVKNSFHLKECRLAFDRKKVDKCGILKKRLSQKTHKCNTSNKSFTCLQRLKRHEEIHEGIKPHKCNICNKAFAQLSHLKAHKCIHDAIRPHKCNICNKAFTRLSDLKRHNLIHEGIKPHKCNICNKAFTQVAHLKAHKCIHDAIRPHKCNICNKAFTWLSDLKRHSLVHEGIAI